MGLEYNTLEDFRQAKKNADKIGAKDSGLRDFILFYEGIQIGKNMILKELAIEALMEK